MGEELFDRLELCCHDASLTIGAVRYTGPLIVDLCGIKPHPSDDGASQNAGTRRYLVPDILRLVLKLIFEVLKALF